MYMNARTGWAQGALTGILASQPYTEGPTYRVIFPLKDRQTDPPTDQQTGRQTDKQKSRKADGRVTN